MLNKIQVHIDKGHITLGREKLAQTVSMLDGVYMVTFHSLLPKNEDEWRRYYFLLRDTLYEDGETGYSKIELHDMAKASLLLQVNQDDGNVKDLDKRKILSTKNLTEKGWDEFVGLFKEWAYESFNCYL
jgi:hypothetical protein